MTPFSPSPTISRQPRADAAGPDRADRAPPATRRRRAWSRSRCGSTNSPMPPLRLSERGRGGPRRRAGASRQDPRRRLPCSRLQPRAVREVASEAQLARRRRRKCRHQRLDQPLVRFAPIRAGRTNLPSDRRVRAPAAAGTSGSRCQPRLAARPTGCRSAARRPGSWAPCPRALPGMGAARPPRRARRCRCGRGVIANQSPSSPSSRHSPTPRGLAVRNCIGRRLRS